LSLLLPNASARSKAPRRRANHVTQDTTSNTTDTVEPFTAAQYAQINQLGHDLSNPSAALADLAAMSQVMQEIFSSVEQDEQGGNTAWALNDFEFIDSTLGPFCNTSETGTQKLHLLRVGSDGSSTDMIVKQWSWQDTRTYGRDPSNPASFTETSSGMPPDVHHQNGLAINAITNADTGVLLSWSLGMTNYYANLTDLGCANQVSTPAEYHLTTTAETAVANDATVSELAPNQSGPIQPVLQLQDGSYVGTVNPGGSFAGTGPYMVRFDSSGNTLATAAGYLPQMATADGGVVSQDGTFFDANLNVTGAVLSLPTQSWRGNEYQVGSLDQVAGPPLIAASLWAWQGGNPAGTSTGARPWFFRLTWQNAFDFIPSNPSTIPALKTDITYDATAIKTAALDVLKQAYKAWPVTV